jgi:pimeloyl-ACP methyl ester carboxylesterase
MRIQIGESKFFFDIEGAKLRPEGPIMREVPTLILLHGGPGFDHSSLKPALSPLADVAQIVYLDQRGQGRSDRSTPDHWTLDQWADDVKGFCDALEIQRPVVMGDSFGGFVAMAYATRHPDHPGKLILSSTAARQRLDRSLANFQLLGGSRARQVAEDFWSRPSDESRADYRRVCLPLYNRRTILDNEDMLHRTVFNFELMDHFISGENRTYNLLPDLGRIRCPTLILAGEDDPLFPPQDAEDIASAIPAQFVRFECVAKAGHGVYRDDPERALQIIRDFIVN